MSRKRKLLLKLGGSGGGGAVPATIPNLVSLRTLDTFDFTRVGNDWQGRLWVVQLPNGEYFGTAVEGVNHSDYVNSTWRQNAFFSADGDTWADNNEDLEGNPISGFPLVSPITDTYSSDACLVINCPNGDVILLAQLRGTGGGGPGSVNFTIYQWRSTDNGKTWVAELDVLADLGYTTDKGEIQGMYTFQNIGSEIYIVLTQFPVAISNSRTFLAKSSDNGASWTEVADITELGDEPAYQEVGLLHLGGNNLLAVARVENLGTAYMKTSSDLGLTWSAQTEIGPALGYTGVHQPYLLKVGSKIVLSGRDNKRRVGNTTFAGHIRNAFWVTEASDPFRIANTKRYILDPYYSGTGAANSADAGYTKPFIKDGILKFVGYYGDAFAAKITVYDMEVGTEPTEIYANNNFLPETITQNGIRLQMNRDNINASASAPVNGGVAIASHAHNTLASSDAVWASAGTVLPELVINNNKGWFKFSNGRLISAGDLPNLLFKASFSVSFWFHPVDGQPSATGIILWSNSVVLSGLVHGLQINHNTAGTLTVRYSVSSVFVTAITASAVFANGTVDPKFISITVTSGGFIEIKADGVVQPLDPSNNGNMSTVTMANFDSALPIVIGQRNNNGTYDVPLIGNLREFQIQPVVYDASNITNLMLN